jgi:hypothetical protein
MIDTDEFEHRLRMTLRAKAEQVGADDDRAFDATRLTDVVVPPPRSRRRLVAVAAVMVVAAAAAALVLVTRPHPRGPIFATESSVPTSSGPTTAPATGRHPIAAPLLAPSWVPAGEELWSLTSETRGESGFPTQLFGRSGADGTLAPGLLIEFQPSSPGDGLGGSGTPVTVRGRSGLTRASKDAGDAPFEIDWIEGDASVRVTVRGVSVDGAVAVLGALRPRGSSLMAGFDPASAPTGYSFLGEHLAPTPGIDVSATFEYSAATPTAGATPDFTVLSDVTGSYPGYLRVWMAGRRAADGTAVEFDPGVGYFVAWPDGRQVVVESSAPDPDLAVLERIAGTVAILDESSAAALAAEAQARVAALPLLGTAQFADGDIELRGTGSPTAICLLVNGSDIACSDPFTVNARAGGSNGALPGYGGSAVVLRQWYVFVAASAEPVISVNGSRSTALPTETGQIAGMHVALVAVPDGVDHVSVLVPTGPNQATGGGFSRPPG